MTRVRVRTQVLVPINEDASEWVDAIELRDGLAVTRAACGKRGYAVTHLATGLRVGREFDTLRAARAHLDALAKLGDWTKEKPSKELRAECVKRGLIQPLVRVA